MVMKIVGIARKREKFNKEVHLTDAGSWFLLHWYKNGHMQEWSFQEQLSHSQTSEETQFRKTPQIQIKSR